MLRNDLIALVLSETKLLMLQKKEASCFEEVNQRRLNKTRLHH